MDPLNIDTLVDDSSPVGKELEVDERAALLENGHLSYSALDNVPAEMDSAGVSTSPNLPINPPAMEPTDLSPDKEPTSAPDHLVVPGDPTNQTETTNQSSAVLFCLDDISDEKILNTAVSYPLCYSSTCSATKSCYSFTCPRRGATIPSALEVSSVQPLEKDPDTSGISPLDMKCYSPRCSLNQPCYSFLCRAQRPSTTPESFNTQQAISQPQDLSPHSGVSPLLTGCYSSRCTPEKLCYSFLCQREKPQVSQDFSLLPAGCYSPRCVPEQSCYAFTCPNKMQVSPKPTALSIHPSSSESEVAPTSGRPWTPSYTVTTQGSGLPHQEQVAPTENDSFIDKIPPNDPGAGATLEAARLDMDLTLLADGRSYQPSLQLGGEMIDGPKADAEQGPSEGTPWTTSYSVTNQPGSPRLEKVDDPLVATSAQHTEESGRPRTPILQVDGEEVISQEFQNAPSADPQAPPSRPWSPSYSVIVQSGSSGVTPHHSETADVEDSTTVSNGEARSWTPSYSVTTQAGLAPQSSGEHLEIAAEGEPVPLAQPQPTRPWSPSYAVTRQPFSDSPVTSDSAPEVVGVEELADTQDRSAPADPASWTRSYSVTEQPGSPRPEPQPVSEEQERPWTPSYAVTTQGHSGQPESKPAQRIVVPSPVITKGITALANGHDIPPDSAVSTTVERPWSPSYAVAHSFPSPVAEETPIAESREELPRPWTPSYSVSHQPGSPRPQEIEPEVFDAADNVAPEDPPRSWTPSYSVSTQGRASPLQKTFPSGDNGHDEPASVMKHDLVQPPSTASYSVTTQPGSPRTNVANDVPDPTDGPWTPSYSVATQGNPSVTPTNQVLSTPVLQVEGRPFDPAPDHSESPASAWTPSYSVTTQPGSPRSISKDLPETTDESIAPHTRPWTSSYTVHRQGSVHDLDQQSLVSTEDSVAESMVTANDDDNHSYPDPSTPVLNVEQAPDNEKRGSFASRYFPAWASASRVDLKTSDRDPPETPRPKEEADAFPGRKRGAGCVIM